MSKQLAWAGIAVLTVYLVFVGGAWYGIYLPQLRLTSVLLAGLGLGIWAIASSRRPELRPRSALAPAIAAALGSLAISTVFSRYPGISLEYLGYAIILAALYLLLVQLLRDEFFRRRFVVLAGGLFVAIVVAYLALVFSHWVDWWKALGRLTVPPLRPDYESLTFGNPSAVLTVVALLGVPIVASVDWSTRRGVLVAAAVVVTVAIVALLTGSRAGWLALAVTGAVSIVLALASAPAREVIRNRLGVRLKSVYGRAALGVAGLAILASAVALVPAILRRTTAGGETNRLEYVQVALRMFEQSPIVGTGPGTWVIERAANTNAGEIDDYIPHAHNVYAQTLAEQGLVGAIAGAVLVAWIGRLLVRSIRSDDATRRRWGWATLVGLVYFAAHQALDFYANQPAVLFLAGLPLAYLDASAAPDRPVIGRLQPRAIKVLSTAAVGIAVLGLCVQEIPAMTIDAIVQEGNAGGSNDEVAARVAADQDPRISPYVFTAALLAARNGHHALAIRAFRTVAERDDLPEAWLDLAAEEYVGGDRSKVEPALRAALRLGIQRPSIAIPAGELALRLGSRDLGVESLAAAVAGAPSFLADPWWEANPVVAPLRAEVADRAAAAAPGNAWEIALMDGDTGRAHTLADSSIDGLDVHDFIDAWAGDGDAAQRLDQDCMANPFDTFQLGWCARIATRQGDLDAAARFRSLAGTQAITNGRLGTELRVVDATSAPSVDIGLDLFWGAFTYRRFTPWDMLVPTLAHLTLQ